MISVSQSSSQPAGYGSLARKGIRSNCGACNLKWNPSSNVSCNYRWSTLDSGLIWESFNIPSLQWVTGSLSLSNDVYVARLHAIGDWDWAEELNQQWINPSTDVFLASSLWVSLANWVRLRFQLLALKQLVAVSVALAFHLTFPHLATVNCVVADLWPTNPFQLDSSLN